MSSPQNCRFSTGWNSDLSELLDRISKIASGKTSLRLISAGSRLALALPVDTTAARIVIGLYQPQRLKGRIFRAMAQFMVAMGVPRYAPSYIGGPSVVPLVPWLRPAADAGTVGFLGCNPAHGWRCVLAGIDPGTGTQFIAKLGLDQGANAVRRENSILQNLQDRFPGIVQSMGCETGSDWALLQLPHLGNITPETMADPRISNLLDSWLGKYLSPLAENAWVMDLIERVDSVVVPEGWHERMMSHRIRRALTHGDFAVWNLRITREGVTAIDWEWAEENGIAGIDLAHGLRQECYMVHRMKPAKAVAWMLSQADLLPWKSYLNACGWGSDTKDWLRLGLLHSHFNAKNDSAELLEVLGIHLNS